MNTGKMISPAWVHHDCGGAVLARTHGQQFTCCKCQQTGQLGVHLPEGMTYDQQLEYLLTQVKEVDLVPMRSGFFFLSLSLTLHSIATQSSLSELFMSAFSYGTPFI